MTDRFQFNRIGIAHTPFRQKFAIPRQPGLCPSVPGRIELLPPYDHKDMVRGLEGFSHIWVLFVFHGIEENKWAPLVRPPRLGGHGRIGVFATRSTHRPNPVGQSVVKLRRIEFLNSHPILHIRGHDLLDGTPVLDIKPYIPYADAIADAQDGFITRTTFQHHEVMFDQKADEQCKIWQQTYPALRQMLIEILQQDPRPAYHKQSDKARDYGIQLYELNIRYHLNADVVEIQEIRLLEDT